MRSYFLLAMCLLFLIHYFVHTSWLPYLLAISAVAAFAGSVTRARSVPRILSLIMFAAGFLFTFLKGQGLAAAAQGIITNLPLLTLLVLVPLLSIPLKMGGFFDSILLYLRRYRDQPGKMHLGISTVLFFLGPILNLGAIRVVHELIKDLRLNATMLSKAYLVGFSATILWSPYYAAVGVTLLYLHVSITDYMKYGFGIALLFLVIGNLMFWLWVKKQGFEPEPASYESLSPEHRRKLKILPFIIVSLMLFTIVAESVTHWSMLVLVSLLSVLFPLTWGLMSKQWHVLARHLIDYRDHAVPIMNNEIVMYISAGFFGVSLRGTTFGQGINEFTTHLAQISFLLFALFILAVMVSITFAGIHQLVVVTVLAMQMDPAMMGTTKEMLAMVFMLAWTASSVLSPVNPINLLTSTLLQKTSLEVGLRDNGRYVLVVSFAGILILTLLNRWI